MKHHSSRRNRLDQSVLNNHEVATANRIANASSDFKDFSEAEVASLNRCLELLKQGGNRDPKLEGLPRTQSFHRPRSVEQQQMSYWHIAKSRSDCPHRPWSMSASSSSLSVNKTEVAIEAPKLLSGR